MIQNNVKTFKLGLSFTQQNICYMENHGKKWDVWKIIAEKLVLYQRVHEWVDTRVFRKNTFSKIKATP